jgi:hypothetical protein
MRARQYARRHSPAASSSHRSDGSRRRKPKRTSPPSTSRSRPLARRTVYTRRRNSQASGRRRIGHHTRARPRHNPSTAGCSRTHRRRSLRHERRSARLSTERTPSPHSPRRSRSGCGPDLYSWEQRSARPHTRQRCSRWGPDRPHRSHKACTLGRHSRHRTRPRSVGGRRRPPRRRCTRRRRTSLSGSRCRRRTGYRSGTARIRGLHSRRPTRPRCAGCRYTLRASAHTPRKDRHSRPRSRRCRGRRCCSRPHE